MRGRRRRRHRNGSSSSSQRFHLIFRRFVPYTFSSNIHSSKITVTVIFMPPINIYIQIRHITVNGLHNITIAVRFFNSVSLQHFVLRNEHFHLCVSAAAQMPNENLSSMRIFLDFIVATLNLYCRAAENRFFFVRNV